MQSEISQGHHLEKTDILVLGTGVAGLAFALKVADRYRVTLISKSRVDNTNTAMAQGGIASVMAGEDHFSNHVQDTLNAGAQLCQKNVVEKVIHDGPALIQDLEDWGVRFDDNRDLTNPEKDLHKEGGHSHRRILHVQDHTGLAIHEALMKRAQEHPNIDIREYWIALDLLTLHELNPFHTGQNKCLGARFFDIENHSLISIIAPKTFLATGGAGKTYLYTSNWEGATGDGIAMAYRAGCRVGNMEFMQFHPTCLFHPKHRNFLISEALRGEGAELINREGKAFTYDYNPQGPLAPRDIVARAIDAEMKKSGEECVYLDIRHKGREFIQKQFPFIYERCLQLGFDLADTPLPVVPAAHYLCGGIVTNEKAKTDLEGLYAAGECAYTGLHGANRLASNSLLECLAFANYASEDILSSPNEGMSLDIKNLQNHPTLHKKSDDELMLITHLWDEIRTCMWNYVDLIRSPRTKVAVPVALCF
ncbi:MAG: L-aspartate oxidase, partial [Pseudomonadota bacterium]